MKPPYHYHNTAMFIIDGNCKPRPLRVDVTVISAEGLNASAAPISCTPFPGRRRLRPFASLTTASPWLLPQDGSPFDEYKTGVDGRGGENPTWGDEFRFPLGPDFFADAYPCLYLCVYDLRSGAGGRKLLGWCQMPAGDFGFPPTGAVRHLSYRLRGRDGTRGRGIVNVAVRVEGPLGTDWMRAPPADTCRAAIGFPVGLRQQPFCGPLRIT